MQVKRSFQLFAVLLSLLSQVAAQTTTGTITGLVSDGSGAGVVTASVSAQNTATAVRFISKTSSTGNYTIANLPVGAYELTVTQPGFKTWNRSGIVLSSNESVRVDVVLDVGQVTERIEITGLVPAMKTESTEVSSTMEAKLVQDLPLVSTGVGGGMRNVFTLALMMPEAKSTNGTTAGDDFQIGGGQISGWEASVDGLPINIGWRSFMGWQNTLIPPVDAVQEFRVDTGSFKADEGHTSGGNMVIVTKSGTNQLHGSAFDYYQSEVFDANSWVNNKFGRPKAIYHRNDFGFGADGPVFIPRIYDGRNKTFFSFHYEGLRVPQTTGATQLTVPTAAMRMGDFSNFKNASGALIPIYDPITTQTTAGSTVREVFPGNVIPATRISPISAKVASYWPNPNRPGVTVNNYVPPGTNPRTNISNAIALRLDHVFSARDRLGVTWTRNTNYWWQATDSDPTNINNFSGMPYPLQGAIYRGGAPVSGEVIRLNETHLFGPNLVNTVTLGFHRFYQPQIDLTTNAGVKWTDVLGGIKNSAQPNTHFPMIVYDTDTYASSDLTRGTKVEADNVFAMEESLMWIKASHSFKFGYTAQILQYFTIWDRGTAGEFHFNRLETAAPGVSNGTSGNSYASFLLGTVDNGLLRTNTGVLRSYPSHSFYALDDWKISPRLTANLGFRLEVYVPAHERHDRVSVFDPTLPNPAANGYPGAMRFMGGGPGTENESMFYSTAIGYGPRAGLAFRLTPNTVLRAGSGIFFTPNRPLAGGKTGSIGFTGIYQWTSGNSGITPAFNWNDGFPAWTPVPQLNPAVGVGSTVFWDQGGELSRLPSSTTWNLAISRTLPGGFVLDATYTGTKGTHLDSGMVNYDQINPQYTYLGSLLNAPINAPAVAALGFTPPFPAFQSLMGANATLGQSLRRWPQYLNVVTGGQNALSQSLSRSGNSTYNALILKIEKRYSNGLSMMVNYTWSKLLTDSDDEDAWIGGNAGAGLSLNPAAQNQYNRRLDKSYGVIDTPHVLKVATSYELPFGKGKQFQNSGVTSQILGGWTLSFFALAQSGYPLGVIDTGYSNFLSAGNPRPNVVTNGWKAPISGNFDPGKNSFFNLYAFARRTNPAADPFGNAERLNGNVRIFPLYTENITVMRAFNIKERAKMIFRWEAYDLFNLKRYGQPGLDLNIPQTFGVVTTAAGNRSMQWNLKLMF